MSQLNSIPPERLQPQIWNPLRPTETKMETDSFSLKKKWSGERRDREQEAAMRPEYGMRRQTVDEEMGRNDKLFFMVDEGKKRETLSVLRLPLPRRFLSGPVKCWMH